MGGNGPCAMLFPAGTITVRQPQPLENVGLLMSETDCKSNVPEKSEKKNVGSLALFGSFLFWNRPQRCTSTQTYRTYLNLTK